MNSTVTTGTPNSIHLRKLILICNSCWMKPRPITFGGVPMGVARPPIEAAKLVIRASPVAYRRSSCPPPVAGPYRNRRIETPIASIMAVVAVFEIHADNPAVTSPNASRMRLGFPPTQRLPITP